MRPSPSSTFRESASEGLSSRPESASSCGFQQLDTRPGPATIPRLPERAVNESPVNSTLERPQDAIRYDPDPQSEGLWRESEAFFRRRAARSLKTQQRAKDAETSSPSGREAQTRRALRGMTLSSSSTEEICRFAGRPILHGEFD